MKQVLVLLVCRLLFFASAHAQITNAVPPEVTELDAGLIATSVKSQTVSNLFVVFRNEQRGSSANIFRADTPLRFGFVAATNASYNVFMLRPDYGFRIFATSDNGSPVPVTSTGAKYGEKFREVKAYDKSKLDMSRVGRGDRERSYWTLASPHFSLSRKLPAPQELFALEKPGKFKLFIEIQVLCCRLGEGKPDEINLVRFPPIELEVVKDAQSPDAPDLTSFEENSSQLPSIGVEPNLRENYGFAETTK